jgi:hypothetical protein
LKPFLLTARGAGAQNTGTPRREENLNAEAPRGV